MPFLNSLGATASLLDVFHSFPETSRPLIEFHEVLLRGPSPFSEGERELIATYVSRINGCRYCEGVHAATTERLGVAPEVIAQLSERVSDAQVTDRMRPVLAYARKLTLTPADITQSDADAVLAAGWDETALYHTVAVTALFNFMNRLVEGLGIELKPEYVEPASKRLAEQGYLPLLDMLNR